MAGYGTVQTSAQSGRQTAVDEGAVYNVNCTSSSDFVVGRQTNFHAPVTIINCPSPYPDETPESIVIRDQLWSLDTAKALESQTVNTHTVPDTTSTANSNNISEDKSHPEVLKKDVFGCATNLRSLASSTCLGLPSFVWFIIVLAILSCLIAGVVQLSVRASSNKTEPSLPEEKIWIGDQSHLFFSKKQWGGLNASSTVFIPEPTPYVIISHTASRFCYETTTCQEVIRGIQRDHMSRTPAFADISFNFLVGGDGYIYEGRGWGVRSPHQGFANNRNIDINFIGDFSVYDVPTPTQVDAVKKLLERGVQDCHLDKNYVLVAHNTTVPTLSPGKNVYAIISTWDHFDPNPRANLSKHLGMDRACTKPTPYER